ncbi:MAG: helicase [Alphaproteobacteria bacterium]|nr:helicase [Alphaproteobacteria bacterium]
MSGSRLHPAAADALREAIAEAGGVEVFAVGEVVRGHVTEVVVCARGTADKVLAILGRPRAGQVVIHNHPSGVLEPSDPDLALAARYSEDGVGFVIVDDEASRARWVVEPWDPTPATVGREPIERFFREQLPAAFPGAEVREPQLEMALAVGAALDEGRPLVVEAGTGTGKSLAYLVPAALWALANDAKVVIATHTRALQAQLLSTDLRVLGRAGLEVRTAVLEGRGNYLCKRRLGLAVDEQEELPDEAREALGALVAWSGTTDLGSRSDLSFAVPPEVWERVESDTDLTLRLRCPHHDSCHFYEARRRAAGAHVVVVNHALLMADLALREDAGHGLLPAYRRVVLDEAHHLEEAGTGLAASAVSALAVRRAVAPLLDRGRKPGALARLDAALDRVDTLPGDVRERVRTASVEALHTAEALPAAADQALGELAGVLSPDQPARRVDTAYVAEPEWRELVVPQLSALSRTLAEVSGLLARAVDALEGHRLPTAEAQPMLDVQRAQRRLAGHATTLQAFVAEPDPDRSAAQARWIELAQRRGDRPQAVVRAAPIDVAPALSRMLWTALPGAVATSATLSVAGDFRFWRSRVGLERSAELALPSPFDHFHQAILGLPTDPPSPTDPHWLRASARMVVDAVEASGGGAFVLCTSYRAVDAYAAALRSTLGPGATVLAQGTLPRPTLLDRFRREPRAVLVGTDSFWEGVSVKGDALRLVIIPRLPFRVPTDPLWQARHERLASRGQDPFAALTLPSAVLRLRQGYGRLLRSRADRGVVLLLDARVHERRYGRVLLAALPPARRVKGPWTRVLGAVRDFLDPSRPAAPTP